MLKVNPDVVEVIAIEPLAEEQVGCVTVTVGADGTANGAAVPLPVGLVHPLAV